MGHDARRGMLGAFPLCARRGRHDAKDYSIIRPALVNLRCKYSDANSDRERVAAVITDRRRAKRNSPSERRIEL
jgi:hypothetical protein